ncbi:TetR/AcrR family transcriptional regulator [Bacillus massilinigeriensis]|uniref:TetR/AcrR family transcriptional regulator n=1 Tax=Bacillus mediterraneensis TaxID=1805474 RepID=UPI0008F959B3|nr:TetR/AcrR family transcriptional regulator [Bacillus mediterraneensis]
MSRKNDSKKTMESILSISAKLFLQKGYDKTSIQDIINELGMSKGVIYYHFHSKEEILAAIMNRTFEESTQRLNEMVSSTSAANAREKLKIVLEQSLNSQKRYSFEDVLEPHVKNPQFIVASIQSTLVKSAPILEAVIREGVKDGSIQTDYPKECAEAFLILITVWCNPIFSKRNQEETIKQLKFLQQTVKLLGMDIMSDELIRKLVSTYEQDGEIDGD